MIPRFGLSILVLPLLFLCTWSFSEESKDLPSFTYLGKSGPNKWGNLSPLYSKCSYGKIQSPVNIMSKQTQMLKYKPLTRVYNKSNSTLVNNGFNIGVKFEKHAGMLVVDGKHYTLKQMHWHTPSEHHIDGVQYPAELHLVHQASDESLSILAMFFQYGHADKFLFQIRDRLDEMAKEVHAGNEKAHIGLGMLKLKHMQKKTPTYYRYIGSLTTPPCKEQVIWNIIGQASTISKDQVLALKAPLNTSYQHNARPVQPLHGRQIELYHEFINHALIHCQS